MFGFVAPPTAASSDRKKMEQLLLERQLGLLLLLLRVVVRPVHVQLQHCPIFGDGVREHTIALRELYRTKAGEVGSYVITLQAEEWLDSHSGKQNQGSSKCVMRVCG